MEPYTVLIIARTQALAKRLRESVDPERYRIRWVTSTAQAIEIDLRPSLLILDLPASGGHRSSARLKQHCDIPILALGRTGQRIPEDVDASLCRPYDLEQLVERIEIVLVEHSPHQIHSGDLCLDMETRRLQMNGELYQLRPIACEILAQLMAQPGQVITRDELFRRVWQIEDADNTRALDVHIAHLRREIEPDPRNPTLIQTERGVGYRFELPE
jgi:DNA-binding response OmpR family regulator